MKRKNGKKGFTLIELLAVIAILAILVVLAVPSVLKLFDKGKEGAFRTQVGSIYNAAQSQYVADQLENNTNLEYCYSGDNKIDLDASSNLQYYVKFDTTGNIQAIKVSDGVHYSEIFTDVSKSKLENVTVNAVDARYEFSCDDTQ